MEMNLSSLCWHCRFQNGYVSVEIVECRELLNNLEITMSHVIVGGGIAGLSTAFYLLKQVFSYHIPMLKKSYFLNTFYFGFATISIIRIVDLILMSAYLALARS